MSAIEEDEIEQSFPTLLSSRTEKSNANVDVTYEEAHPITQNKSSAKKLRKNQLLLQPSKMRCTNIQITPENQSKSLFPQHISNSYESFRPKNIPALALTNLIMKP